ncbi:hypothetical protein JW766_03700 [Candidatus Dojkabacteria bacterium]|nr:hypothetical protein [Candidatus Dojkabacteria bacterium]
MPKPEFDVVWSRIVEQQEEVFRTIGCYKKTSAKCSEFTYRIEGEYFYPSKAKYKISKSQFRKAYDLVPFKGPGVICGTIRGPSYIWAVFHDPRISLKQWRDVEDMKDEL